MPALYVAIQNRSEAETLPNDGRELILHIDAISAIGEEVGMKRLDEYVYAPLDDIAEFLLNAGASREELEKADEEIWYAPEEGLKLFGDYIDAVKNYHSLSETTKSRVIPELEQFCDVLRVLAAENNPWRLQYDV